MYSKNGLFIILLSLFFSCNSDSNNDDDVSIIGNWVIEEITYNGSHGNWGECGHLENISFYDSKIFSWELYAIADEYGSCIPIPSSEGTWEYINNNKAELTLDDHKFEVNYNMNHLYMDFFIEPSDEDPEGIAIHFVFIKS